MPTLTRDNPVIFVPPRWPLYVYEGMLLAMFMLTACLFGVALEHPDSPLRQAIESANLRRGLMGVAMALTAIALIYNPLGRRSGAHMNPAVTLTFLRLRRIGGFDAAMYIAAQFLGGAAGVAAAHLITASVAHPAIRHVVTTPGPHGPIVAFIAEVVIAFITMTMVLTTGRSATLGRLTGVFAAILVACYITFEAPLSGMSLNPARTLGSAVNERLWTGLWIYFTAPPLGMLAAAELQRLFRRECARTCCKLNRCTNTPCIATPCHCAAAQSATERHDVHR